MDKELRFSSPKLVNLQQTEEERIREANDFNNLSFVSVDCLVFNVRLKNNYSHYSGNYCEQFLKMAILNLSNSIVEKARILEQQAYDQAVADAYEELDELTDKAKVIAKKLKKKE